MTTAFTHEGQNLGLSYLHLPTLADSSCLYTMLTWRFLPQQINFWYPNPANDIVGFNTLFLDFQSFYVKLFFIPPN